MNGGVLIMKKYLKEILILLIQLFMFYVFPLFAARTLKLILYETEAPYSS